MVERTDGAPPPNVRTFNTMIEVFGHARQLQKSFEYFRMLSDDDFRLEPDARYPLNQFQANFFLMLKAAWLAADDFPTELRVVNRLTGKIIWNLLACLPLFSCISLLRKRFWVS
jgi:pentatricopeptide repeat protein